MGNKAKLPWFQLSQVQTKLHNQLWCEENVDSVLVEELRGLIIACRADPDADVVICYHEALATISEVEQDWEEAIKHRGSEISQIKKLHESCKENSNDLAALEGYREEDLAIKYDLLNELKSRSHYQLIKKGLIYHESFQYDKAMPFFERAFEYCPKCPASIYNYANTLHMLHRNEEAKRLLEELLAQEEQVLREGCPESCENPESFKLDALFLMYYVVLEMSGSFEKALSYAEEHLRRRRRGLKSAWTKRKVLQELSDQRKEQEKGSRKG